MRILHISDIHMNGKQTNSISTMISEAIKQSKEHGRNLDPDILVITGDFTTKALASEFDAAKNEIMNFTSAIPSIKDCIIVPGNHDYLWREDNKPVAVDKRHIQYECFRTACLGNRICKAYPHKLPKALKSQLDKYLMTCSYRESSGVALLVIGLNSVMLDSEERAGQGYFSKSQLEVCGNLIQHYKTICDSKKTSLIVAAAFHHHILPVASLEQDTLKNPKKFSLTLDARRTLNFFAENGVVIAMHGHQHQPSVVSWRDAMSESANYVHVSAAGSMKQDRADLGDVSRNSFMIYDISQEKIDVYCFQNKDSDWDIMVLSHPPYSLAIKPSFYEEIPCNVRNNALLPKEIVMANYFPEQDTSDLFYYFLSVGDCDQTRKAIWEFSSKEPYKSNIDICGIHHLYGKYDILLKYRAKDGDLYKRHLREHLINKNLIRRRSDSYFMNVSTENQNQHRIKEITQIPILPHNPEAYIKSTWNMATLTVYLANKMSTEVFLSTLNTALDAFNAKFNTHIQDIIRSYAIGQDQSMIFELFISCYQFPMLTRFTNLIEDIIRDYGVDKSTHIIYYFDERHI